MEELHCAATIDDDQEGEWREIFQRWDEHTGFAAAAAHPSDDHGLTALGSSMQQPTCTSMLTVHSSLAMETLHPIFMSPNPNSNGLTSSMSLGHSLIPSPHSLIPPSIHQLNSTSTSLEAAVIDQLNSSAANLSTIDAENLISTVRQQEESADNSRSSWFSMFLQSLQAHPGAPAPTGLASSSASYNNLLNIGVDDNQQGVDATAADTNVNLYSNPQGIDEMMEHMDNDFINLYGGAASLQEQLSNALCASDMVRSSRAALKESEGAGTSKMGSGNDRGTTGQTLLCTPASSVSSDGGPEDDSDSHEDMKDSLNMAASLDAFDDLILPGEHSQLNAPSSIASPDTLSSKAAAKAQGETSAAPSSNSHDHDKKRASKSGRVTKKPKRERGAKLAIKIQSDVEVLDDGYKWRKYGQKAVKNSPFPRSYYKCTDKQCKVKKHVERQAHEPDYVVTTYEGVHNHSRPDQQVQVLHSQSDVASQQHDSFQAFVPTPSTHHLSAMELFGLRSSRLFQADSQPMSLPSQQATLGTQQTLEAIDEGILQNLLQGEPRKSSN